MKEKITALCELIKETAPTISALNDEVRRFTDEVDLYINPQPMSTAPASTSILLLLDDDDNKGQYWMEGWRSARAWRTKEHVNAEPLAWRKL